MLASVLVVAPGPASALAITLSFDTVASATSESGTHDVTVVLSTGGAVTTAGPITVEVTDAGTGSAGAGDYSFTTATLVFPLGSAEGATLDATITINTDSDHEADETIDLDLAVTDAGVDAATAVAPIAHTVTINDNDPATVAFDAATSGTAESGTHSAPLALSIPGGGTLSAEVIVNVADDGTGSAATPADYSLNTSSVTFPAGAADGATRDVNLAIVADDVNEADETVDLSISLASGPAVASGSHEVTINDDDSPGVTVNPAIVSVTEGQPGVTYSVVLTSEPTNTVTVNAVTTNGEATVAPASLNFGPANWDQPKDFTVTAVDDGLVDGETSDQVDHTTSSADPMYDDIAVGSTSVTVFDDDEAPIGNPDTYSGDEGGDINRNAANGVLNNDSGEGTLTATLVAGPSHDAGGFILNPNGSFLYTHDGSTPPTDGFTYRVVDGDGNQSPITQVTLLIANVVPVVVAGPDPAPVSEGQNVAVNATFTDPGLGDTHTATINWGDGAVQNCSNPICTITFNSATGNGTVTGSHSYSTVGVYTVTVTVNDGDDPGSDGFTVTVQNANLTVDAGTIADIDEGDEATLVATFDDNDGSGVHNATVTWGDGTVHDCSTPACRVIDNGDGTGTVRDTHVYNDDGAFTVEVTVFDASGDTGAGGSTATVANVDPIAQITDTAFDPLPGSSNGGEEGVLLRLRSTIADPGADTFDYSWKIRLLGQEVASSTTNRINYRPPEDGTYFVSLIVTDKDDPNSTDADSVLIVIDNAVPVIREIDFDATPAIGVRANMVVHFTDPGSSDEHTTTVAWGEGSPQAKPGASPRSFGHNYNSAGTRSALVCVTDDDGGESCESFYVNPGTTFGIDSDFNGDGFEDLPIAVPGEGGAGAVNVLYGTNTGLSPVGDDLWRQGVNGIGGTGEAGDGFGSAIAWGDFNLDGYSDLAVSAPGEDLGGEADVGLVHVIYGSSAGLTGVGDGLFHQDTAGIAGSNQPGDRFGDSLTVGDFNGDGFADLGVGVPNEDILGTLNAGRVGILFGSPNGLVAPGDESWDQDKPGLIGVNKAGDRMGDALSAGDFDRDGYWDIVAGIPGKDTLGVVNGGAVLVMGGSLIGMDVTADQWWHQDVGTMKNSVEAGDHFGAVLEVGDYNGDSRHDLAIGVPDEGLGGKPFAGGVAVMLGRSGGLSDVGNAFWHENTAGVKGVVRQGDRFGFALASGDFNDDGRDDLAIGIPYQEIGPKKNAGDVAVLYGAGNGLSAGGDQRWNEDTPGIKGVSGKSDHLGWALRAFDQGADGDADLVIGIPDQNIAGNGNSGSVLVIKGRAPNTLSSIGDTYWHQDTPGVSGVANTSDRFGKAL